MEVDPQSLGSFTVLLILSNIIAIITSGFAVWRSYKLTPKEVAKEDANAAEIYARTAAMSEQRAALLGARLDELERQFDEISRQYDYSLKVLAVWARGIELLLYQMKNAGLTAVWIPNPDDLQTFKHNGARQSDAVRDKPEGDAQAKKRNARPTDRKSDTGV